MSSRRRVTNDEPRGTRDEWLMCARRVYRVGPRCGCGALPIGPATGRRHARARRDRPSTLLSTPLRTRSRHPGPCVTMGSWGHVRKGRDETGRQHQRDLLSPLLSPPHSEPERGRRGAPGGWPEMAIRHGALAHSCLYTMYLAAEVQKRWQRRRQPGDAMRTQARKARAVDWASGLHWTVETAAVERRTVPAGPWVWGVGCGVRGPGPGAGCGTASREQRRRAWVLRRRRLSQSSRGAGGGVGP